LEKLNLREELRFQYCLKAASTGCGKTDMKTRHEFGAALIKVLQLICEK
jgi:hypothetical protein